MTRIFSLFARRTSAFVASPAATICAALLVVAWALSGRVMHYDNTWQITINTISSIVTFLMVFVIAHAQKVDSSALMLKIDALIAAQPGAPNALIGLEHNEELFEAHEELRDEIVRKAVD